MLIDLAREWVEIIGDAAAKSKMAEVEANLADTYFAWAGRDYQRQGRVFQNPGADRLHRVRAAGSGDANVDHIHTMYRDPTNDYAARAGGR